MKHDKSQMSTYQLEEYSTKIFVLAAEKLRMMGVIKTNVVRRKTLLSHMALVMEKPLSGTEVEFVEQFLEANQHVVDTGVAPSRTAPSLASRRPYKLPIEMQIAAQRARAEQPELISVNGKLKFINLGGRDD
jgi:hypothetical protein